MPSVKVRSVQYDVEPRWLSLRPNARADSGRSLQGQRKEKKRKLSALKRLRHLAFHIRFSSSHTIFSESYAVRKIGRW